MGKYSLIVVFFFLFIQNGFSQETDIESERLNDSVYLKAIKANGVKIITIRNQKYKVWTKKVGTGKIKLLLLHGGPGTSPEYFENFATQLGANYTIYFYSQLGTYFSDIPKDAALYTIEKFVNDIEEIRKALHLNQFYILGHSWGNQLAQAYAAKYQQHLKGLILCNNINEKDEILAEYQTQLYASILDSIPEFARYADSLRLGLTGEFTNFSTADALGHKIRTKAWPVMLKRHYARLPDPMPDALMRSKKHSTSRLMASLGFTQRITETDFNKYLVKIKIPTLLLGAKYDFIPSTYYLNMRKKMILNSNVDIYICPYGSHFAMWDDSENFFKAVTDFIIKTEKLKSK